MPANQIELTRRAEKVAKLVAEIDRLMVRCDLNPATDWPVIVNVIRDWTPEHWSSLAMTAGCFPPSPVSRAMVVGALKARARRSA